jgi:hypothetical protein
MSFLLRTLGYVLGLLGGLLLIVASLLALASSVGTPIGGGATGRASASFGLLLTLFVIGIGAILLARRGRRFWAPRRTITSGGLLLVLGVVALVLASFGGGWVLIAGVLILIAGLFYLAEFRSWIFRLFG